MAHEWENFQPWRWAVYRWRRCRKCGAEQQFSTSKIAIGEWRGGWHPLAGRCVVVRLRRAKMPSTYQTPDGVWAIWQEETTAESGKRRWFLNKKGYDETRVTSGFGTKAEAKAFLRRILAGVEDDME
jgi:hypothetical protein